MRAFLVIGLMAVLALAACGGSSGEPTTAADRATETAAPDSAAVMRDAVERALADNLALSRRALWTNEVPPSARNSTRGAALIEMRRSAADRRRDGVRVRVVERDMKIEAIRVEPSYERAAATVVLRDRVRIHERKRSPRIQQADERVLIELRRVDRDDPPRFVVWQVSEAR